MASEYLKWKYRDEKREERRELTPEEKRKNWWHYHKWHVVTGVVLAGIGASLVCSALGVGQIKPDYQAAYVGENPLPGGTAAAIENAFASLGEDLNGDGRVTVRLNQYPASGGDPSMAAARQTTLMGDLLACESYFFLLEDPEKFQADYEVLEEDRVPVEGGLYPADGTYLPWAGCPVLAEMELGSYSEQVLGRTVAGSSDELVSGLYLAHRGFRTEKTALYPEGCGALWNRLTEGAVS